MDLGNCSHARINSGMLRASNTLRWVAAAVNPFFAKIVRRAVRSSFRMKSLGACTKIAAHPAAYVRRPLYGAALVLSISSAWAASDPQMPDPTLTPGSWHSPPTPIEVLCQTGYTKTVRHVTKGTKAEVFRRYGYDPRSITWGDYEVDHLVCARTRRRQFSDKSLAASVSYAAAERLSQRRAGASAASSGMQRPA